MLSASAHRTPGIAPRSEGRGKGFPCPSPSTSPEILPGCCCTHRESRDSLSLAGLSRYLFILRDSPFSVSPASHPPRPFVTPSDVTPFHRNRGSCKGVAVRGRTIQPLLTKPGFPMPRSLSHVSALALSLHILTEAPRDPPSHPSPSCPSLSPSSADPHPPRVFPSTPSNFQIILYKSGDTLLRLERLSARLRGLLLENNYGRYWT